MTDYPYKAEMEAWVTGHSGGTATECLLIVSIPMISFALWGLAARHLSSVPVLVAIEMLLFILPLLLALTWLSDQILGLLMVLLLFLIVAGARSKPKSTIKANATVHKTFLTVYRSLVTLITCMSILAVDFRIFPRRFAKVETWGISLMDIGVGSFVFAQGLMQARKPMASSCNQLAQQFSLAIRRCLPLFALGFARLLVVKSSNYQEHVTEYGMHWNFFFTLACLPPLMVWIRLIFNWLSDFAVCTILTCGYQFLLSFRGLQEWILTADRTNLLAANKEGVCSLLGYAAIFSCGRQLGRFLLHPAKRRADAWCNEVIPQLTLLASATWSLYYVCSTYLDQLVSRRMANGMYILCTGAFNLTSILLCLVVEQAFSVKRPPLILESINLNQLAIFLLANLCTGLINKSIRTLYAGPWTAIAVLLTYSIVLVVAALMLHRRRIYIRF